MARRGRDRPSCRAEAGRFGGYRDGRDRPMTLGFPSRHKQRLPYLFTTLTVTDEGYCRE